MLGTIGDVGAASIMSGKSFAIGEAGILWTNDREIYERAVAFGSYDRFHTENIETEYLKPFSGLPLGGYKHRMHQMSAAAVSYFMDLLKGLIVDESDGSTMAGWYVPVCLYDPEALGGLSITRFCEALCAEGVPIKPGINRPLHTHPIYQTADIYNDGMPTRIAFSDTDIRKIDNDLSVSQRINERSFFLPWFKHFWPEVIKQYADAF